MPRPNAIRPTKSHPKDKHYAFHRVFGAVSQFEDSYDADAGLTNPNQDADGRPSFCFAYTVADIGTDQDDVIYSHDYTGMKTLELMNVPPDYQGGDARQAFASAVDFGLLPKELEPESISKNPQAWAGNQVNWPLALDAQTVKKPAYLPITRGSQDYFDAIRSALVLGTSERRTVGMGTQWSPDFTARILTLSPRNLYWGHLYKVRGWDTFDGVPYLFLKIWDGTKRYMSRELCNSLMGKWGTYAATIRDVPTGQLDEIQAKKITILQAIISLLENILRIKL